MDAIRRQLQAQLMQFRLEGQRRDIVVVLLLFMFPLCINTLRHWVSVIYYLLFFATAFAARARQLHLEKEEKIFLALLILHVASNTISNTLNGWTKASLDWTEADLRFVLAAPIYLYVRTIPNAWRWFVVAIPIGALVIGVTGIVDFFWQYFVQSNPRPLALGAYGHIFMGNIAILLSVLSVLSRNLVNERGWRWFCSVAAAAAAIAAILSLSRNAWLSLLVLYGLLLIILLFRQQHAPGWRATGILVLIFTGLFSALANIDYVDQRIKQVFSEPIAYFNADRSKPIPFSSLAFRLEQWRGAVYAFEEKPLFGHGVGNIGKVENSLIREGKLNQLVYHEPSDRLGTPSHVHSVYFQYLAETGIVGLTIILLVLFYPVYLAIRSRHDSPNAWMFLLFHNVAFVVAGLTEIPFIRNNWSSVFLLFNLVFLAWLMQEKSARQTEPE